MNLTREIAAKDRGMDVAAASNSYLLKLARTHAKRVAFTGDGTADIERVRESMLRDGVRLVSGNWMGSVFKGPSWRFTGKWVEAAHKGGHGRMVRVWQFV